MCIRDSHWADPDTVGARGRFRRKAAELGISADRIFADGDGLGLPIIDDFRAEGFPVHSLSLIHIYPNSLVFQPRIYRGGTRTARYLDFSSCVVL